MISASARVAGSRRPRRKCTEGADGLKTITVEVSLFSRAQFREWLRGQQSKNKYIDVRFTETEEARKSLFKIVVSGNSVKVGGWCLAAKSMVKKLQEE